MDISLQTSDLFNNISAESYNKMMTCFSTSVRSYKSGETICFYDSKNKKVGIVESGKAIVINTFLKGSQTILEYLTTGSIFGEIFYFHSNTENISVVCSADAKVRFIDYTCIIKTCSNACAHHTQLINNMFSMVSQKASQLSEHIDILSRRSIREKLVAYFSIQSSKAKSQTFKMPFSFSVLADYISSDRSAMMREIKKMRDEGIIIINKKTITFNSSTIY